MDPFNVEMTSANPEMLWPLQPHHRHDEYHHLYNHHSANQWGSESFENKKTDICQKQIPVLYPYFRSIESDPFNAFRSIESDPFNALIESDPFNAFALLWLFWAKNINYVFS